MAKKVSNAKTKKFFLKKNLLVSNDSEMSNSARNDGFWRELRFQPPKPKNTRVIIKLNFYQE